MFIKTDEDQSCHLCVIVDLTVCKQVSPGALTHPSLAFREERKRWLSEKSRADQSSDGHTVLYFHCYTTIITALATLTARRQILRSISHHP
ncbi:hypothetical protein QQF64_020226 [Cirrhinus molitorella]|uniref:Uncharacterized protein n=1 Tax=Cirrhinus molitorella TaxID=172907 RepID=A0ABR3LB51_9TELE